ncbi:unnamed protein product [Rotaria sordida]|nr:unnamed protein product [Rotaria sordida]CAF1015021.1 unnamed protein product [Rotaria sordida]CAF1053406.1 unnamed protein product [Rotaria sordida]CAF3972939.1 unnamed protein product [Rotaria sordida]
MILTTKGQFDAVYQFYGQSSVDSTKELHKLSRSLEKSPTFIQSRRYHFDQLTRDIYDLDHPLSFIAPISSSYYYSYSGLGTQLSISSQEACRLTNNFCLSDYQCCSEKCRCIKWSIVGKMSCWKKCF